MSRKRKAVDQETDIIDVQYIKKRPAKRNVNVTARDILLKLAPGDPLTDVFIEEKEQLNKIGIKFVHDEAVPYGDVWFCDVTEKDQEPGLLLCMERKTQRDLESSVQHEQRWALQRDRMLESEAMVVLVIEGNNTNHPLTPSITRSCLLKFRIYVLRTANVSETFVRVCEFYKDLKKGSDLKTFRGPVLKYGPKEQKEQMALAFCLSMVYRVTMNLGMAIQNKYKTMKGLLDAYDQCATEKERENMLVGFTYRVLPDATTVLDRRAPMPNVMTVPVNTSKRIYYFLYNPDMLKPDAGTIADEPDYQEAQ